LVGLYGGSYSALPTNAAQLIQLFDNNGNVNFYLDPATNSSTIFANFIGSVVSNVSAGAGISVSTSTGSVVISNTGVLSVTAGTNTNVSSTTGNITIWTNPVTNGVSSLTAGTGISVSTSTGSVTISNTGVLTLTAGTNTNISASSGNITIWTTASGGGGSTFDISTWTNQRLFTTSSVAFNQISITGTNIATTVSAVSVNLSGVDTITPQNNTSIWAVNRPGGVSRFLFDTYINPDGSGLLQDRSFITGRRARGTASAPTAVQSGDVLMRINAFGYATTKFLSTASAGINFTAAENFTDSATGGKISFDVLSTGTISSQTSIMIIDQTGVEIRNKNLSVTGGGDIILSTGSTVTFGDGTIQTTAFTGTFVTPFDISTWTNQRLFTTSSVSFAQLTITGTNIANTQSAILVNLSGSDVYPGPGDAGYGIWQINKPGSGSNQVNDTFGDSNTAGQFSRYTGRRARGTAALPTAVQNDDILAQFQSNGFGTTDFSSTATGRLRFSATENFTDAARGTQLSIWLNKNGQIDPSVVATFNETGLKLFDAGDLLLTTGSNITFGDGTIQTTAFTGTVVSVTSLTAGSGISVSTSTGAVTVNNTGVLALTGTAALGVSASTGSITLTNLGVTSLTAGTNTNISASTGSVTIWVNNTTPFDISTWTNQRLFTTSTVQFSGMSLSTGTEVDQVVSAGGYPLDGNGQALIGINSTQSGAMVVSNYTAGLRPEIRLRGYGQNMPNGTASTTPSAAFLVEGSRGTNLAPTAIQSGDTLGALSFGGYDGANWLLNSATGGPTGFASGQQFYLATEAFANNGSTTTNAGTRLLMRVQPQGAQVSATSRQYHYIQTWTAGNTATNSPPQLNIFQGTADGTLPNLTPSSGFGSFGTGFGATNFQYLNSLNQFVGVTFQDAAPDNPTLLATNVLTISGNRRSGANGRRNALLINDTVGQLQFNAQLGTSSTNIGSNVGSIFMSMLENASSTARGTSLQFYTTNLSTTTQSLRLSLTNGANSYYSDNHVFANAAAGSNRLVLNTTLNFNNYNSDTHNFNNTAGSSLVLSLTTGTSNYNNNTQNFNASGGASTRLSLQATQNVYNSDNHRFYLADGSTQKMSISTTTNAWYTNNHSFQSAANVLLMGISSASGANLIGYTETQTTAAFTATFAPNVSTATIWAMPLTGNITFNGFTNPQAGQSAVFFFTQDATGNRLLTSTMKFSNASKTLSTAGTSTDMISVLYAGAAGYYASLVKGFA
jgi:hypothetical protein